MKNRHAKNFIGIIIVFLICAFFNSCVYTTYTGRYWLGKSSNSFVSRTATDEDNQKIVEVIKSVAIEYGFFEDEKLKLESKHITSFSKGRETKGKHEILKGADGPLSIVIDRGPYPDVLIRDWENNYETEFVQALKSELEKHLSEVIDMNGVLFKRDLDVLN
jgi:hypothetical protein